MEGRGGGGERRRREELEEYEDGGGGDGVSIAPPDCLCFLLCKIFFINACMIDAQYSDQKAHLASRLHPAFTILQEEEDAHHSVTCPLIWISGLYWSIKNIHQGK